MGAQGRGRAAQLFARTRGYSSQVLAQQAPNIIIIVCYYIRVLSQHLFDIVVGFCSETINWQFHMLTVCCVTVLLCMSANYIITTDEVPCLQD